MRSRPRLGARSTLALLLPLLSFSGLLVVAPPAAAADDVRTEDARVPSGSGPDAVELDTTLFVPASAADHPAPAVVLEIGLGWCMDCVS